MYYITIPINKALKTMTKHPVQHLFDHLTHIVEHVIPKATYTNLNCNFCGRPAHEFDYKGHFDVDGYIYNYMHCTACESYNFGDSEILGVEKFNKGHPVPHQFGMMAGTGCVVTSSGRTILFVPPATYAKLPPFLLQHKHIEVIKATQYKSLSLMLSMNLEYPLVYVQNFGKKTKQLIKGLRWSFSPEQLIICSDDGNDSSLEDINTINMNALKQMVDLKPKINSKLWGSFNKILGLYTRGICTPIQFTEFMSQSNCPELIEFYRLLPLDPHKRQSTIKTLQNFTN